MALRMLEVTVPQGEIDAIPELVGEFPIVQIWTSTPARGTGLVRILLHAEHAEGVSDLMANRFESRDSFRLVLLPVEATVPAVESGRDESSRDGETPEPEERGPERISREELYEDISQAGRMTRVYLVMVALSAVVAAVGLTRGDPAIVIGAMVIAPLLGPNIALALASTLGDLDLVRRSVKAMGAGVAVAGAVAFLAGLVLTVDPSAPELVARTQAGVGDIILALAAGSAGSLAFTSGVSAVVVGVMVAVALLPPLVAAGLLAGGGYLGPAWSAVMLLVINVTCINLAAVATFLVQRVRPRTWWEAEKARKATRIAVIIWIVTLAVLMGLILLRHWEASPPVLPEP